MSERRKIHLAQLDPLRGFAILGVLLFHSLSSTYHADQLPWNGNWRTTAGQSWGFLLLYPVMFGGAGVVLFFVISGFLIHYSTTTRGELDLADFARKRFWRIYPPYLAAVLLFTVLGYSGLLGDRPGISSVVAHLALIHNARNDWLVGINPSFWSLATECQLYAIYPILWWVRRRMGSRAMLGLSIIVSTAIRVAADFYYVHEPSLVVTCNPFTMWFEWTIGAYVCDQFLLGRRVFTRPKTTAAILGAIILAAGLYRPAMWYASPVCALLFAVLVEAAIWKAPALSRIGKAMTVLGLCSYSVYLLHQPLMLSFARVLEQTGLFRALVSFLIVAATFLALSWSIGPLLYRWVERPSIEFGRRRHAAAPGRSTAMPSTATAPSPEKNETGASTSSSEKARAV